MNENEEKVKVKTKWYLSVWFWAVLGLVCGGPFGVALFVGCWYLGRYLKNKNN